MSSHARLPRCHLCCHHSSLPLVTEQSDVMLAMDCCLVLQESAAEKYAAAAAQMAKLHAIRRQRVKEPKTRQATPERDRQQQLAGARARQQELHQVPAGNNT